MVEMKHVVCSNFGFFFHVVLSSRLPFNFVPRSQHGMLSHANQATLSISGSLHSNKRSLVRDVQDTCYPSSSSSQRTPCESRAGF